MEINRGYLQRRLNEVKVQLADLIVNGHEHTEEYWELKAQLYTISQWLKQPELQQPSQQ